jgi:N-acylneuraminate cytidylyltransferase/CMP-N,N'-diacetyllegionaminic acid synthase
MRTLFVITARGGSKGVPGKNLAKVGGISLVGFKAISAKKSKYCSRLIVSTDSEEIQEEARRHGVEVPFTRPAELATDSASSMDALLHAMSWVEAESGDAYDAVMLLEPSAPFARASDYDNAVETMVAKNANVVVGVRPMEINSVFVGPLGEDGKLTAIVDKLQGVHYRRQDVPQEYTVNGTFYLARWAYLQRERSLYRDPDATYGLVMDPAYSVEIDAPIDLQWADFLLERGHVDISNWT